MKKKILVGILIAALSLGFYKTFTQQTRLVSFDFNKDGISDTLVAKRRASINFGRIKSELDTIASGYFECATLNPSYFIDSYRELEIIDGSDKTRASTGIRIYYWEDIESKLSFSTDRSNNCTRVTINHDKRRWRQYLIKN